MRYSVKFEKQALKSLKDIDKKQSKLIMTWIENNLDGCENPRRLGKPLKGKLNEYWRYRVGQYRVLVEIKDDKLMIVMINIGHRKDIYK